MTLVGDDEDVPLAQRPEALAVMNATNPDPGGCRVRQAGPSDLHARRSSPACAPGLA